MGKIERIQVSPEDRERLARLVRDRNTAQKIVWRSQIVLLAGEGMGAAPHYGALTIFRLILRHVVHGQAYDSPAAARRQLDVTSVGGPGLTPAPPHLGQRGGWIVRDRCFTRSTTVITPVPLQAKRSWSATESSWVCPDRTIRCDARRGGISYVLLRCSASSVVGWL